MPQNWSSEETAERVLDHLHRIAHQGVATCSFQSAGDALDLGRNTVGNGLRRLLDNHAIAIDRMGTGRDYPTSYRVLRPVDGPRLARAMRALRERERERAANAAA